MATKFAIKVDNLNLFHGHGGWRSTPDDAIQFNTVEEARAVATRLNKPGLVIITLNTTNRGNHVG
jgi:hypothetical protein